MLGLYFHIPFCKRRCGYCDFCSTSTFDNKLMDRYLDCLLLQLADYFPEKKGNTPIDTLYFGGGTPSVFGGKRIARLIKEVDKRLSITKQAEITVEVNPESCDKALCKQLKAAGVNRISMGIQSASDSELFNIGRLHNFEQAQQAVALVKKYVTDNISLDLIFGLPNQTMESWNGSLRAIMALEPAHISAYALKLEEGCPMYGQGLDLPDDDQQADMYLHGVAALAKGGYAQYEISNFCREGRISRHNSKYWDLSEYLGLGASAHSLYCGRRFGFTANLADYMAGERLLAESEDVVLPLSARKGEYIMLMLRTAAGIDEEKFYKLFREDFAHYHKGFDKYIQSGHLLHDGSRYHLTAEGFLISNAIIGDILEEL